MQGALGHKQKPQCVHISNVHAGLLPPDVYSGMYARVTVNFFPYDASGKDVYKRQVQRWYLASGNTSPTASSIPMHLSPTMRHTDTVRPARGGCASPRCERRLSCSAR